MWLGLLRNSKTAMKIRKMFVECTPGSIGGPGQ